ncbi:sugar ABC transporter substrate-binding protein [Polaromonas sp.]|uniref:sugar ABC transporter substrate-binding protein n=1 Tax=Polaromonas sp. TaxID=1869339 RepID=UPI0032646BF4
MKRFIIGTMIAASLTTAAIAKDVKIGLSWDARESALNQAWEDYMRAEAKSQGAARGINVTWVVNMANNDSSRQAANIEDLINSGVNIIIARALDSAAIGSSIRAAKQANVAFVTFDRASSGEKPTAHVGGDSKDQAKVLGEEFQKLLKARNVTAAKCIEVQGSLADINAINRTNEFKKLDSASSTISIVARVPSEWNPERVLSGLTDAFRAHKDANCLLLASDWAIDAVRSAAEKFDKWHPTGNPKHVWIASNDLLTSAITAMENGYIDVAVTWDAQAHAKEAVRVLLDIAEGKDPKCVGEGCLAKGSVATPATVKGMTNYWARKYK